jgi:hypothetical protein
MVSSEEEMRLLMQFWAKTLTRRSAMERMEGLVEVTLSHGNDVFETLRKQREHGSFENG